MLNSKKYIDTLIKLLRGPLLFPVAVMLLFSVLVGLGISGSSVGVYSALFNGDTYKDPSLIAGTPQKIRSDEWTVTTQMVIAQSAADFPSTNLNIGKGQNMNIILDVPAKDWSQTFRPQNWAFFALPLENAFAFKWWYHSLILLLAVYFFALFLLPKRYATASLLAIIVTFSAFFQWWYGSTLSMFAYPLLIALAYMLFIKTTSRIKRLGLSVAVSFLALCFAIMLYPPFQIPCIIALASFIIGYTAFAFTWKGFLKFLKSTWLFFVVAGVLAAGVLGLFMYQNRDTIATVQNTTYPGKRIAESGGYSVSHLFSGSLASQFLKPERAPLYQDEAADALNQSESSTFILISAFLVLPILYVLVKERKRLRDNRIGFIVISLCVGALLLLAWMFIPGLSLYGNITKLSTVPVNRVIFGLGFINFILLVIFIWIYSKSKITIKTGASVLYGLGVFVWLAFIHLWIYFHQPGFIGIPLALALALPVAISVFLLLKKLFVPALLVLTALVLYGGLMVNPLYKGLQVLTDNSVVSYIRETKDTNSYWIAEDIFLENAALMAGKKSLSGVFTVPQLSTWKSLDPTRSQDTRYNRYAHVSFNFDKDPEKNITSSFIPDSGPDQIVVKTEMCSAFIKDSGVRHVVSSALYSELDQPCITSISKLIEGKSTFYAYSLSFSP